MIHYRIPILSLLLLIAQHCLAQVVQPDFNIVRGTNTFTIGKVGSMAQDKYGYIWFADQSSACLVRYDGYRVKTYRNDPADSNSLAKNQFESIASDPSGNIWTIVPRGADKFDVETNKFIHYRYPPGEGDRGSNNILVDHTGIVWLGTGNGLDRLDPATGKFTHYVHSDSDPSSLSYNIVRALYEDKAGTLWVGTGIAFDTKIKEGGLNRFNKETGTFTRYLHDPKDPQSLISNKVRAIFEDSKGNFWVGTDGDGLHRMNREKGTFERLTYDAAHPEKLSRPPVNKGDDFDHITFITEDITGKLWIGTYAEGIATYDPVTKKMDHFTSEDKKRSHGYTENSTWAAFVSRDGTIWISNEHSDLYRVDPLQTGFSEVKMDQTPDHFMEDSSGNLWITTDGNGLVIVNKKTNKQTVYLHHPDDSLSISSNRAGFLQPRADGQYWVGSFDGLNIFNPKTGTFKRSFYKPVYNDNVIENGAFGLLDTKSQTYFGIYGGLIVLNKSTGDSVRYTHNDADTTSIAQGGSINFLDKGDGNIWITVWDQLEGGLDLFNVATKKFSHYLQRLIVWDILKNSEGKMFVGTSKGIFLRNDSLDTFIPVGPEESEFRNCRVKSMTEDGDKNIWGVSSLGIFRFNPHANVVNIYGDKFGTFDVGAFSYENSFTNSDGEIYFGNPHGYYKCFPHAVINSFAPQIAINDFKIDGHSIMPGKDGLLKGPVEDVKEITLNYNQNTFSIDFAGIHFADPENNGHQYMLEGYEKEWRNAASEKSAYYYNVSPGHYTFRIKATNSYGITAKKSFKVIVLPPWWQTWWAYILYGVLFIVAVWSFIRWRTKALSKEKIMLEYKVAARTQELKDEKEIVESTLSELKSTQALLIQSEKMASLGELTAGIAHEIQNPLNFVNNFSEINTELMDDLEQEADKGNLQEVKSLAKSIRANAQKINHHGKRADAIIKGMLQHSRASSGQKEPTAINALADEYLRLAYHGLRAKDKSFNATMKTDYDAGINKVNIIPQDIGRVLLNLYNNAFYAVNEKKKNVEAGTYEPTVTVSTKAVNAVPGAAGSGIIITVRDNGSGIPQKVIDKIFQPFFTTKPTGQGTGLGLSLSYDIVKAHRGELKVESKENEFTEFVILLPV